MPKTLEIDRDWYVTSYGYIVRNSQSDTPFFDKAMHKHNQRIELRHWRAGAAKPFKTLLNRIKEKK